MRKLWEMLRTLDHGIGAEGWSCMRGLPLPPDDDEGPGCRLSETETSEIVDAKSA